MFTLKRPTAFYVPLCIIFVRYHNAIHDYHLLPVFIVSQERGAHKEVKKMDNNKKPSEPLETEGRVMEDEIQKLKRSSLILSVACFVQSLLLLRIVWQISDIYSTLEILLGNFESVYGSILSLRSGLIPILETVKNLLL